MIHLTSDIESVISLMLNITSRFLFKCDRVTIWWEITQPVYYCCITILILLCLNKPRSKDLSCLLRKRESVAFISEMKEIQ